MFEEYHKVKYTDEAIKAAVELSANYIDDRKLPDKAIDVIDETGASQMLVPEAKRKKKIGVKEVEATVATMARIPPKSISKSDAEVLAAIDRDLKRVVFGQDKAIEALASTIKLARAGLREPEKPIGCYLFSGPTGVGKTEVAKQLAALLGVELLRFDMSEYMERHTVSRLIGAPPGYVGFDQGGLLTDGVDQHPHSVLLLDEIEKAHPDLFNILLQVMDHGKLTDHNGKKVDFRNVILIMTTNAGASDMARPAIGFDRAKREGDDTEAINRMFTPEFRNRLDAVIPFAGLPPEVILKVVEKFVFQLEAQLADRDVTIELDDAAASGWPRRATTRSSAPGRSRASSRSTSRSRWPTNCCSASSSTAARCASRSPAKVSSASSPSCTCRPTPRRRPRRPRPRRTTARTRTARPPRWWRPPRARPCPARKTRRTVRNRAAAPCRASPAARTIRRRLG